jgi:hypothetical protein
MAKDEHGSAVGRSGAGERSVREQRLGEALRRNLQLRKQQLRGRSAADHSIGQEASGPVDLQAGPKRRGSERD